MPAYADFSFRRQLKEGRYDLAVALGSPLADTLLVSEVMGLCIGARDGWELVDFGALLGDLAEAGVPADATCAELSPAQVRELAPLAQTA